MSLASTVNAHELTTAKSAFSPHGTTSNPRARAMSASANDSYAFTLHPRLYIAIFSGESMSIGYFILRSIKKKIYTKSRGALHSSRRGCKRI